MGQLKVTLTTGNNNLATAHSDGDSVVLTSSGAVNIAFGESATANSFPIAANLPYSFNGRNFSRKNVNLYSAAGGEVVYLIW